MEDSVFKLYDYASGRPYVINLPNENESEQEEGEGRKRTVLMVPMNEVDPYLVQVPDPQYQSADLYILEMP